MAFTNSLIRSVSRGSSPHAAQPNVQYKFQVARGIRTDPSTVRLNGTCDYGNILSADSYYQQTVARTYPVPVYSIIVTGSFDDRRQLSRIRAWNTRCRAPNFDQTIRRDRDSSRDSNLRARFDSVLHVCVREREREKNEKNKKKKKKKL